MDARGGRRRDENRDVLAAGRYVEMSRQMSRRRLLKARTNKRRQRDARLRCAVDPTAGGDPNGQPSRSGPVSQIHVFTAAVPTMSTTMHSVTGTGLPRPGLRHLSS